MSMICPEIPTNPEYPNNEICVIALGWFWHPQRDYQDIDGVKRVVVGYTGGKQPNPTYKNIMDATESVLIEYDPTIVSYEALLNYWANSHAPFYPTKAQYKSAIFYVNEKQKVIAEKIVEDIANKKNGVKVYTDIEAVSPFYKGEEYHQDFLNKQMSARY